jgi:hypothetical protein
MQNYWFNQQRLFLIFLLNKYRDFLINYFINLDFFVILF